MDTHISQQLKSVIEAVGYAEVSRVVLEYGLGASIADGDALIAILDPLIASKDWLTGYEVNYLQQTVIFKGPTLPFVP
jgi:hypothetical protein